MHDLSPGGPLIDVVAIELALTGRRRVELTKPERLIAAAFILAAGGRQADVVERLGISKAEASRMRARICLITGFPTAA
jgi:hypothetical protein